MNTRSIIAIGVSIPILAALIVWLYAAALLNLIIPPLVNDDTLTIDAVDVTSVGWRQLHVARLSGTVQLPSGRVRFDVDDATVGYDPGQRRLGRIGIRAADIEYSPSDIVRDGARAGTELVFPPDVVIERLRYRTRGSIGEFDGHFELNGIGSTFAALGYDDKTRIKANGDSAFTDFHIVLEGVDGARIASADVHIEDTGPVGFQGDFELGPTLAWLQAVQLLPADYQDTVNRIKSAVGSVRASGQANQTTTAAHLAIDVRSIDATDFYGSALFEGELNIDIDGWAFENTQAGTINIHVPSAQLDAISSVDVELPAGYVLRQAPDNPDRVAGQGSAGLTFVQTGDVRLQGAVVDWQVTEWKEMHIKAEDLNLAAPYAVTAGSANATINLTHASPLIMEGDLQLFGVRTADWPAGIPSVALKAQWTWNDDDFKTRGTALWNENPVADWSLANLRDTGRLRIELEKPLVEILQPAEAFLKKHGQDIQIFEGTMSARLDWNWDRDRYRNQLDVSASGIGGRVFGLQFDNGALRLSSSDLLAASARFETTISNIELANDVNLRDLDIAGRWQNGLHIDKASMSILGGNVGVKPVFLDPSRSSPTLELQVTDIDLNQVFAMLGQEALNGSGKMSGAIPLRRASGGGIEIDAGNLKSTTKGTISYNPGDASNTQLDNIALQALQDFRYDMLDANLDYQTSGDYAIRARLEGRNPALYNGYPIAFNINLTGSLPGLLRASLITGDFHSEILKQIRQKQE